MQLAVIFFTGLLSAYFLAAAFLPAWRIWWGRMSSISLSPPLVAKERYRKPSMGGLSSFGLGLFLAGFPMLHFGISTPVVPTIAASMFIGGFVLGIVGQVRDKALEGQGWKRYKSEKHER